MHRFYLVFAAIEGTYLSSTCEKIPTGGAHCPCSHVLPPKPLLPKAPTLLLSEHMAA